MTLSEVQALLSNSVGAGLTFATELNLVRARLLQSGSWKGAKELVALDIHTDSEDNSIVTLPRKYESILAGAVKSANVLCSGAPLGVRNGLAEFSPNGLGYGGLTQDFTEVNGRFAVFQEWTEPKYIRLRFDSEESAGIIHLIGKLNGADVWSVDGGGDTTVRGEKINFISVGTFDSVSKFDAVGFSAVKPVTVGRVLVSALNDDATETKVAVWEPSETVPRLKRYKIPDCSDTENQYIALAKLAYVAVSASDDEVVPGNIAALEKGLEARKAERAQDLPRAGQLWAEAQALLAEEGENDSGGARSQVQVADDFSMACMGSDWPWPGYEG